MKFLGDMGLAMSTIRSLHGMGHDAMHLREERLHRLSDEGIMEASGGFQVSANGLQVVPFQCSTSGLSGGPVPDAAAVSRSSCAQTQAPNRTGGPDLRGGAAHHTRGTRRQTLTTVRLRSQGGRPPERPTGERPSEPTYVTFRTVYRPPLESGTHPKLIGKKLDECRSDMNRSRTHGNVVTATQH